MANPTVSLLIAAIALAFHLPAAAQDTPTPGDSAAAQADEQLFAVLLEPGPAWKPGRPFAEQGLREHFNYWMALFGEGRIVTFGPLGGDSGLILLRSAGQEEADAILAADPAVVSGTFTGTARPYVARSVNIEGLKAG